MQEIKQSTYFYKKAKAYFKDSFEDFFLALKSVPPKVLRFNSWKLAEYKLSFERPFLDQKIETQGSVPFCSTAHLYSGRPGLGNHPWHKVGGFYIQDPSTLLITLACKLASGGIWLDLCAAPGGKTTLLSDNLPENSLLLANEVVSKRCRELIEVVNNWGDTRVIVGQNTAKEISESGLKASLILLDAPCSGDGMGARDPNILNNLNAQQVLSNQKRQREIIAQILPSLAWEGIFIYATCSFNVEENEENVAWILATYPNLELQILPEAEAIANTNQPGCYRLSPDKFSGGGFFMAVFKNQKTDDGISLNKSSSNRKPRQTGTRKFLSKQQQALLKEFLRPGTSSNSIVTNQVVEFVHPKFTENSGIFSGLRIHKSSWQVGSIGAKGNFTPAHQLALSNLIPIDYPGINFSLEEAKSYLNSENLSQLSYVNSGQDYFLAKYENLPLGWLKLTNSSLQNRYKK